MLLNRQTLHIGRIVDMKLKSQIQRRSLKVMSVGCVLAVALLLNPNATRAADAPVNAETFNTLLDHLETGITNEDWGRVNDLRYAVTRLGPGAIPFLLQRMKREGVGPNTKLHLFETLRGIPGENTTETLLDLTLNDPDPEIARMAGAAIGNQSILKRGFSDAELDKLIARIRDGQFGLAVLWARILARAEHVDKPRVAIAFIERFAKAISENVGKRGAFQRVSILSREGLEMGGFLWVFPSLDVSTSLPLLKKAMTQTKDEEARKWWLIALGMTGDKRIGNELQAIVGSKTEDVSVRALALRAYAYALGAEAIPFLCEYVHAKTVGPNPAGGAPLLHVATEQLARIQPNK